MIMPSSRGDPRGECTRKRRPAGGGPPETVEPSVAGLLLAGELPPLHVGPDLLRHLGRPDRRAAEDGFHRVLTALEADRVPSERLLPLRHVPLLVMVWLRPCLPPGVLLPHVRGEGKRKYHLLGGAGRPENTPEGYRGPRRLGAPDAS